jgi:hypothetical protein
MSKRSTAKTVTITSGEFEAKVPGTLELLERLAERLESLDGTFTRLQDEIDVFLEPAAANENARGVAGQNANSPNSQVVGTLITLIDRVTEIEDRVFAVTERVQR